MKREPGTLTVSDGPFPPAQEVREKLQSALVLLDSMRPEPQAKGDPANRPSEEQVRAVLRARRNRDRFFPANLFADPAWDMLLELYSIHLAQWRVSVSSLCGGSGVPATTALRWINNLEQAGLIVRRDDPTDGRRVFVELSQSGIDAMNAYFEANPLAPV